MKEQIDDITQKYRSEVLQRKLLYNKVQELRGNIRVFCRVRQDTRCGIFPSPPLFMPSTTHVLLTAAWTRRTQSSSTHRRRRSW